MTSKKHVNTVYNGNVQLCRPKCHEELKNKRQITIESLTEVRKLIIINKYQMCILLQNEITYYKVYTFANKMKS